MNSITCWPISCFINLLQEKNHTNLCSTTIPIAYIWKWQESRMPSPTLWAQKQGAGRRANTPARGAGTEMGTGMGRKCIGATSSCTPPQRSRRLSSAGLEPVPLLGEELSRKYFTHRTQEMFRAAMLHAQTQYSCALPRYANMMRIFVYYVLENRKHPSLYFTKDGLQKTWSFLLCSLICVQAWAATSVRQGQPAKSSSWATTPPMVLPAAAIRLAQLHCDPWAWRWHVHRGK